MTAVHTNRTFSVWTGHTGTSVTWNNVVLQRNYNKSYFCSIVRISISCGPVQEAFRWPLCVYCGDIMQQEFDSMKRYCNRILQRDCIVDTTLVISYYKRKAFVFITRK